MFSHTYICILNQLLICNHEYISRVCSRLELLSAHLTTNFKIPNTTKFQCNKQKLKGLLYIKRPVLSMLTMHLYGVPFVPKLSVIFQKYFLFDLPKIVQIVRDLVNGMLRFSKWDAAI